MFAFNSCWCCCYLWHSIRWINDHFNHHFLEYRLFVSTQFIEIHSIWQQQHQQRAQTHTNFVHLIKLDLAFDLITYSFNFCYFHWIFFFFISFHLAPIHSLTHLIIWFKWTLNNVTDLIELTEISNQMKEFEKKTERLQERANERTKNVHTRTDFKCSTLDTHTHTARSSIFYNECDKWLNIYRAFILWCSSVCVFEALFKIRIWWWMTDTNALIKLNLF